MQHPGNSTANIIQQPGAYFVLVVLVQVDATLLRVPPVFWNTLVDVGLMYYLWYQLWQIVDQGGIRCGDLGAVYSIC